MTPKEAVLAAIGGRCREAYEALGVRFAGKGAGVECPFHCPLPGHSNGDQNPSASLNTEKGVWCCQTCSGKGDIFSMAGHLHDLTRFPEQLKKVAQVLGVSVESQNGAGRQPQIVETYPYRDESGALLYEVVRKDPKTFCQRRPDGEGAWVWGLKKGEYWRKGSGSDWYKKTKKHTGGETKIFPETRRVLYRLSDLQGKKTAYLLEGEKDADNSWGLNIPIPATCNVGGAGKWREEDTEQLKAAGVENVVIVPDNDEPGERHAAGVARSCFKAGFKTKIVHLPGLEKGGDVSDWFDAGRTRQDLAKIVGYIPILSAAPSLPPDPEKSKKEEKGGEPRRSQAQDIVSLAANAEFFHTPDGEGFATIEVDGHKENWPVRSKIFKLWLRRNYFSKEEKPPNAQAMQDALGVIEAEAMFKGPEFPVFLRIAELNGDVYFDLCNNSWEAIEVKASGWRVVNNPSVKFRRAKGMMPLPMPEKDGSLEELRSLINVPNEGQWRLVVAWLIAALRPEGPFPVLCLQGEQGSAKSTTARILRALIDPSVSPLRTPPREERDLMIAAKNGWVLCFDNLSGLPRWLSDALCRMATGGGLSTRELYSDSEEVIFSAMRPTLLNGIDDVAGRNDLIDRALVITLPPVPSGKRRTEKELRRAFETTQPSILGAMLDAVSEALRNIQTVNLQSLPRMADFAEWVVASEAALPWEGGGFLSAYDENRTEAVETALEADAVSAAVLRYLEGAEGWEGTSSELLPVLGENTLDSTQRTRSWPKSARALSGRLRRAATFLRGVGIEVVFSRESRTGRRLVTIRKSPESIVTTVKTTSEI